MFNGVGAAGFALQLCALGVFASGLGWPPLPATAAAVELALLLNFVLHERWTWRDRAAAGLGSRVARLCRFHMLNGAVSMTGNLAIVALLTGELGLHPVIASATAVAACSIVNFMGSDRLVFRHEGRSAVTPPACDSAAAI